MNREEKFNEEFIKPRLEENHFHTHDFHTSDLVDAMKWADENPKSPWIKCSERLPDEHPVYSYGDGKLMWNQSKDVYVAVKECYSDNFHYRISRLIDGAWECEKHNIVGMEHLDTKVIAWMPIPKFEEK